MLTRPKTSNVHTYTTECHLMSQLTLALHHAKLFCLWYGVSSKQHKATLDLNPASSNLFLIVRGDTMPVTSARISAVVIRLFVRSGRRILLYYCGVILLEGPMPALLATLLS